MVSTLAVVGCATMIDPNTYSDDLAVPLEVADGESVELRLQDVRGDLVALEFAIWASSDEARNPGSFQAEVLDSDTRLRLAGLTLDRRSIAPSQRVRLEFPPSQAPRRNLAVRFSGLGGDLSIWWTTNSSLPSITTQVAEHDVGGAPALTGYYRLTPVSIFQDIATGSTWRTTGVASMLLLLVSGGYLIGRILHRPEEDASSAQRFAIGVCLVMPVGAVILLWLSLINISVPKFAIYLVIVLALLALFQELLTRSRSPASGENIAVAVALVAIFATTLLTRLAVIRDFDLPLWGDGVHHSLIAQQMLERLTVPDNYGALVGHQPFTYHFGLSPIGIRGW